MSKKEKSLKESLKRLKEITQWFDDSSEVDLEEGLKKVKEGVSLIKQSRQRFAELENEFEEVKKDLSATNESEDE